MFVPDPRTVDRQQYCFKPACRKASKAASQARWRVSAKGRDYFRGPANTLRVRTWRAAHPGYWRSCWKSAAGYRYPIRLRLS